MSLVEWCIYLRAVEIFFTYERNERTNDEIMACAHIIAEHT